MELPSPSGLSWGISSVGRALPLQGRCQRFEPAILHKILVLAVVAPNITVCEYLYVFVIEQ